VPDPLNQQAWNRYSYVGNDPLTFTKLTGFAWPSHFFQQIGGALHSIFSPAIPRPDCGWDGFDSHLAVLGSRSVHSLDFSKRSSD
jgi:hypothetical protein